MSYEKMLEKIMSTCLAIAVLFATVFIVVGVTTFMYVIFFTK